MSTPMMKCGHAANATSRPSGKPVCFICAMADGDAAHTVDETPPSLEGRRARCNYYGRPTRANGCGRSECNYGGKGGEPCACEQPSSPDLPFFEKEPASGWTWQKNNHKGYDGFYCGCMGWD